MGSSLAVARAARALARLPRAGAAAGNAGASSGIADPRSAFSQQMRRVLIALHAELDGGLRNMETASGDAFAKQARTALVPAGSAAPPALGGDEKNKSFQTKKESRAETHLDRATRLFSLLACVFRAPFPSAAGVAVPADLVLGAVRRALAADGAGVAAAPGLPATAAPPRRCRAARRARRGVRRARRAPRGGRRRERAARRPGRARAGRRPARGRDVGAEPRFRLRREREAGRRRRRRRRRPPGCHVRDDVAPPRTASRRRRRARARPSRPPRASSRCSSCRTPRATLCSAGDPDPTRDPSTRIG